MKKYEARVYIGKDLYNKLNYIAETTGVFSGVNGVLASILKEDTFTQTVDNLVLFTKQFEEQRKK